MTEEMSGSFLEMIEETLDYCDQCESQVHDFIKIANCVLKREEYYEFLSYYRKFENNFGILESLVSQISNPISTLQAISIGATIKELRYNISDLVDTMELSNIRIDTHCINFEMASLIEKLDQLLEFDAIDYDSFVEAMESEYIVLSRSDVLDQDYNSEYYPMLVLSVKSFKDKISAYEYALGHGIRKDFVVEVKGHLM